MSLLSVKMIVNPVADAYPTRRKWPRISQRLERAGIAFDHQFTEGIGHAIELAKSATDDGYRHVVAVGGDGTVSEVINGLLSSDSGDVALGVIGIGTGCDFIRSVGIPGHCDNACTSLANSDRRLIDVGIVEYRKKEQNQRRFFINAAGVGFDASVVAITERFPKYLGGHHTVCDRTAEVFI